METAGAGVAPGTHTEHEDHPWTIQIPDHEKRTESDEYEASRAAMNAMAKGVHDFEFGASPFEDHHGGGLWLKDDEGWFLVRNLVGIEWSAQFCADPAKVDQLRVNARRLYAGFPAAVTALGIRELLDTPIVDAAGVTAWTDSICNASVPLPHALHVGVIPGAVTGGIHHYPSPIAEIDSSNAMTSTSGSPHQTARSRPSSRWHPAVRETGERGCCWRRRHRLPGPRLHWTISWNRQRRPSQRVTALHRSRLSVSPAQRGP